MINQRGRDYNLAMKTIWVFTKWILGQLNLPNLSPACVIPTLGSGRSLSRLVHHAVHIAHVGVPVSIGDATMGTCFRRFDR